MSLEVDHIVFCVEELEAASQTLRETHHLVAQAGGRHPGHGTANMIVPLGSAYLELVSVGDESEAAESSFGRWVTERASAELSPDALCLRTDDLDTVASKLQLEVTSMGRYRPDGVRLSWRLAGLERTIESGLPFFIQWDIPDERHPGRTGVEPGTELTSVEMLMTGNAKELSSWVQDAAGIDVAQGSPGIARLRLHTQRGVISI